MHAKTDSETTSVSAASWQQPPPRTIRPAYYVQSPSNHDVEKTSHGSGVISPNASPSHHHHHHHRRESASTSHFSGSLKSDNNQQPRSYVGYKNVYHEGDHDYHDGGDEGVVDDGHRKVRLYFWLLVAFIAFFTLFCLILWGASKPYRPKVVLKEMVFESFNVQAGSDLSGVSTDMLTLNSTVRIVYRNPATSFAVHVTSTPLELSYFQLQLASGQIDKFSQPRMSQRSINTWVQGNEVPLYGSIPILLSERLHPQQVILPLNLTFTVRSRAYLLGRLVKSKFYSRITCSITLRGDSLGKSNDLSNSCSYE